MAKARHTNKGGRNLPTESPTEAEDAQEWVTPDTTQFPQPVMLMQVYDYGEITAGDGRAQAYVVMEMLDGEPLSARLRPVSYTHLTLPTILRV